MTILTMQNCEMTLKLFYSYQEVLLNKNKIQLDLIQLDLTWKGFTFICLYMEYTEMK